MSPSHHILARQTVPTPTQPTTTLALSTAFTPPAACTQAPHLTLLNNTLWWNEPVPHKNTTQTSCYPSEFLLSYTSAGSSSSIVPALRPLICPKNFCTAYVGSANYIACCPSGYAWTTTSSASVPAVSARPAYGGVCYSEIVGAQKVEVEVYGTDGREGRETVDVNSAGVTTAYAHVIDGWAFRKASLGCKKKQGSTTWKGEVGHKTMTKGGVVAGNAGSNVHKKARKKGLGKGAVAGIILGALVGLGAILGLVLFLLKRKREQRDADAAAPMLGEERDGESKAYYHGESDQVYPGDGNDPQARIQDEAASSQLGTNGATAGAYDMGTERVSEVSAKNNAFANRGTS